MLSRFKSDTSPATLSSSLRTGVRLVAWCNHCLYQVDADLAALVERYREWLPVPEWGARLRCSKCGSRDTAFVVTGDGGMPREEGR
jgi:hypothetical protein